MLKSALGAGLSLPFVSLAANATEDPRKMRPRAGDHFVFPAGDRQGQIVTSQDLPLGGPPLTVYATDPATRTVRDGSRLNRVLLVRLAPEELAEHTRTVAAEGIVAYSAVCTHTACDVSEWKDAHLVCPCHASTFDPKNRARVMSGPAPRPLAALPLRLVDGVVTVAGPFAGRVGAQQQ
ncbi:MAG: ubiquinol-cytochrome c reductase iron-sulfur subunit [Candidatus Binatia bacterium]